MRVTLLLVGAGTLFITGCASHVDLPALESNHPANPNAAAAPVAPPSQALSDPKHIAEDQPDADMQRMDHGSMQDMDDGSMEGMNHRGMHGMHGMEVDENSTNKEKYK
jgi:hypothetical protein